MISLEPTKGERLLIRRRRLKQKQKDAARVLGVTLYRLRQWEADKSDPPDVKMDPLVPFEVCFILRRRQGRAAGEFAKSLGVSLWWLCQMEYGVVSAERLIEHWETRFEVC